MQIVSDKWQIRDGALQGQKSNCKTVTNVRLDTKPHLLTDCYLQCDFKFDF
jgi:hypothetical protein